MRRGSSAIVRRGEYYGDKMSVDHVLPRAEAPGLDNVLANLELMPQRMNSNKSAKIADREKHIARRFVAAGLVKPEVVPWAAPFPGQSAPPPAVVAAATPTPAPPAASPPLPSVFARYFCSRRSGSFHLKECKSVATISPANLKSYGTRQAAIEDGKKPCGLCKP